MVGVEHVQIIKSRPIFQVMNYEIILISYLGKNDM
jgi:hypothetical protein